MPNPLPGRGALPAHEFLRRGGLCSRGSVEAWGNENFLVLPRLFSYRWYWELIFVCVLYTMVVLAKKEELTRPSTHSIS